MKNISRLFLCTFLALSAGISQAQMKVGVTLSTTGPAASLGLPEKNAVALMPTRIGNIQVEYIVLDDASDTTGARRNIEKLTFENNVDLVIGSTTTPNSLTMLEIAGRTTTPMISLGASDRIITPVEGDREWVFKTPYGDTQMALKVVQGMLNLGAKNVAYFGFNDAYGESWHTEFSKFAQARGLKMVASERFNRTDTSVTAQVLKIIAARPDAILIGASGTPGVLPQASLLERGFQGKIFQTHGVLNNDFLRVGGNKVEGTLIPSAPVLVAEDLPRDHPAKKVSLEFKHLYEKAHGPNSITPFAANAWDAWLLISKAVPVAAQKARPGTPEFRRALRDALESTRGLAATQGVVNMSRTDHNGFAIDAPVMVQIKGGKWTLAK
ncbi:MAG: branched-chain amino acid transporter substrate-binding protein [Paucimonas sp.]|nr:branched-chain amino acid transporter substrate-binding protein [Paucimonas sp.]